MFAALEMYCVDCYAAILDHSDVKYTYDILSF